MAGQGDGQMVMAMMMMKIMMKVVMACHYRGMKSQGHRGTDHMPLTPCGWLLFRPPDCAAAPQLHAVPACAGPAGHAA
eukprot:1157426-Pelagomonas_calceolata.AAC.4